MQATILSVAVLFAAYAFAGRETPYLKMPPSKSVVSKTRLVIMIAVCLSPSSLVRDRPSLVAVVSLCPLLQHAAASTQLSRAPRGGLASGHGGPSRTQAQAISCLVVVSCCWRSLSRKAPASCRSVPFTQPWWMVWPLYALRARPSDERDRARLQGTVLAVSNAARRGHS